VLTTDYCWRFWTCRIAAPYKFHVDWLIFNSHSEYARTCIVLAAAGALYCKQFSLLYGYNIPIKFTALLTYAAWLVPIWFFKAQRLVILQSVPKIPAYFDAPQPFFKFRHITVWRRCHEGECLWRLKHDKPTHAAKIEHQSGLGFFCRTLWTRCLYNITNGHNLLKNIHS